MINVEVFRCSAVSGWTGRGRVTPIPVQNGNFAFLHIIPGFSEQPLPDPHPVILIDTDIGIPVEHPAHPRLHLIRFFNFQEGFAEERVGGHHLIEVTVLLLDRLQFQAGRNIVAVLRSHIPERMAVPYEVREDLHPLFVPVHGHS